MDGEFKAEHRRGWRERARAMMSRRVSAVIVGCMVAGGLAAGGVTTTGVDTAAAASASTKLPGWLHTSGSSIRTSKNTTYVIKAVAWFGMETTNCAPHGLWSISVNQGLKQIKSMGFNTVRLPFSNECLAASSTNSIDLAKNPKLAGTTPLQVMDYIVKRAKAYGLNIILDRHRPDSNAQSALWYTDQYSEARWIADWKMLAKRYKKSSNVVGFDLHNEPHGDACWGCGNAATDWRAAATRAGNAVLKINPKVLIIIEGVERQSTGTANTWWGGGLAGVATKPVKLKVAHRVVYSPHDYPSSIYAQPWFAAPTYPKNLPAQWDANWGFIDRKGIAPILLGEFGTKLETTSDKQWLKTMVSYLKKNGMSFAYWSFNPNSGDTGGLVKDDWTTRQSAKLAYLKPLLGKTIAVNTVKETEDTEDTTGTTTTTPTTPTATRTATASWMLQSSWQGGYVTEFDVTAGLNALSDWTITWPDATATGIATAWGMTCTVNPGVAVTCAGSDWGAAIPAGSSKRVGVQVTGAEAPSSPTVTVTAR